MKATELMIGDWVCYDGDIEYSCPIKIEGMDVSCGFCVTSDRDDAGFNGVIPIPLTAEILEKNGFVKFGRLYEYEEDDWIQRYQYKYHFEVLHSTKDGFLWKGLSLEYIHELQHTLRLCGLNKLADNFKV